MYLDHAKISATHSETEPDRLERLYRVYGYAIAMADMDGNAECITKLAKIHDHKGTLMVIWHVAPTEKEKNYFLNAWKSKVGDESTQVEHALMLQDTASPAAASS
ncbi:MAG: hypothetical protein Q7R66_01435 [Undibacterium sp.]|uniref:hypothetical protein n=1 Tax=Undibacterium sp. TaxID=1914977 RepID=UPI0027200958|nr:hypothetical protein [Undibacterium sp.]MDO8650839.1 hypothetical protein [Undibacterium sp.]